MYTLKRFTRIHKRKIIGLVLLLTLAFAYKSFMFVEHQLPNHPMVGKQIAFNKPLLYIKEGYQYISIVDKIGVYLSPVYQFSKTKIIAKVPADMTFTVRSVYFTDVKFSGQTIFYILEDRNGFQSIISKDDVDFIVSDLYR
jgi:hypothetical protein